MKGKYYNFKRNYISHKSQINWQKYKNYLWQILKISILILVIFMGIFLSFKPNLLEDVSFSRAVFDRNGHLLRLTTTKDEKYRLFINLDKISPKLRESVILLEDQYFYSHLGVNPASITRAFFQSYIIGGRKIGASTITMQLARLKYNIKTRNFFGKAWQILRAVQFEIHYSKDQLLEAYLNLVPYGFNIEGVGAASFIYFQKKPIDLTLPEIMTLSVIPQNPNKRKPEHNNPRQAALITARNKLFIRWLEKHPEDSYLQPFFTLPLTTYGIKDLPFEVPHLTFDLLDKYKDVGQIYSSIEFDKQKMLENILKNYVFDNKNIGINNAAAILVDNKNMEVLVSIGSANFFDKSISGQVDGTRAKRSPGSTLKPFIYALAFDQGLIHPRSILSDAPINFGSFSPDNFDKDFKGPITASDALRFSRNIPALKLAEDLKSPDLYSFLQNAQISKLRPKKDYGLSLVLGGAEVTLCELAELYSMLANDGVKQDLKFVIDNKQQIGYKKLLSAESSFMVLDILGQTTRPNISSSKYKIYWKTGTSNGFHDAWTAGVFGNYTLIVWVGNFNGKNSPSFIGVKSAAPLFFQMADAIAKQGIDNGFIDKKIANLNLRQIEVCGVTGDLESDNCPAIASTWFIPGLSPIKKQNIYRKILVNTKTGKIACEFIDGVTQYQKFEIWPSDLLHTLNKAGIEKPNLPESDESCDQKIARSNGTPPIIISPQSSAKYYARLHNNENEGILLNASADGQIKLLHWFINNSYFGKSKPNDNLEWYPKAGNYNIIVTDEYGRSSKTNIKVLPTE